MSWLAGLYEELGRNEAAEMLYECALVNMQATLPSGHPDLNKFEEHHERLKAKLAGQERQSWIV
jgi:hypothetical protein